MAHTREDKLNIRLAGLLAAEGLDAEGEDERTGGRRIDVFVRIGGRRIAVEAKKGNLPRDRDAALAAAAERLEQGLADAAVAVCYPESLALDRLAADTPLRAAPLGGVWSETDAAGLAAVVRRTSDDLSDIEKASATFRDKLKEAAAALERHQVDDIAASVSIPLGAGQPGMRAALLVASACLFHARLDEALARGELRKPRTDARTGRRYDGRGWPFPRLGDCLAALDPIEPLSAAWDAILAVDYKPVFETALTVIGAPAQNRGLAEFARGCGYAALGAVRALTGGQTDLLGRVFHRILDEAKHTGAFYTSSAAAALLAGIAVRDEDVNRDLEYQIVDPACGTGTLLAAAAARVKDAAVQHGRAAGRHLIEEGVHGFDIDIAATHMAAVTLGLMAPDVAFRKMNIHRFHLGEVDDPVSGGTVVRTGSLELMGGDGLAQAAGWPQAIRSGQVETGKEEVVEAVRRDLVIMNPPFTRDSLRYGQLPKPIKRQLKDREKWLFNGTPVHRSHYGGMFLTLADRLCDEDSGTLALVLPTTGTQNPSTGDVRRWLLEERFHLETVVTSHDPDRIYFSENTHINESLFVFRRPGKAGNGQQATRFIQLARNPSNPAEAALLADALRSGRIPEQWGREVYWPRERVLADDWTPVRFLSPYLVKASFDLFSEGRPGLTPLRRKAEIGPDGRTMRGGIFKPRRLADDGAGLTPLRRTAEVGPAGQALRGGIFKPRRLADEAGRRGMWYNNQEEASPTGSPPKQTLQAEPDCYLHTTPQNRQTAARLWTRRARLLLPARFRLTTGRTFALVATERVLGSLWIPVKPLKPAEGWEESMAVYLNSTVGVLAQIRESSPHSLQRPSMSIDGMRRIRAPDLTAGQTEVLAAAYEEICGQPLERLSDATGDPVRKRLDEAVCDALGLAPEQAERIRSELAAEPSVTGRPAGEAG